MGLVVLLLLMALVFGGVGLFAEGLRFLMFVGLVMLIASFFTGFHAHHRD